MPESVRRAAEAIEAEIKAHPTFDPKPFGAIGTFPLGATMTDLARAALGSLDVGAMARSVADDLDGQDVHTLVMRRPGESRRDQAERIGAWAAGVIDAAIRGDDSGEADPGLLVILLGAVLVVLPGAAALAIATGIRA
ncbi:hypothetical protein [Promicromonospora sp. NFX87]|uniref:hypothetical protein n=1 Tax=Promicromonospora sp. NFX87 TaxID=3402691 RepID=UPI003AFB28B1